MNEWTTALAGAFFCCGWPLIGFAAGIGYMRYGLPIKFTWRGFQRRDQHQDED